MSEETSETPKKLFYSCVGGHVTLEQGEPEPWACDECWDDIDGVTLPAAERTEVKK